MTQIIDGRSIAKEIRTEIANDVNGLITQGITPHLSVVLVGNNPASQSYVGMKARACEEIGISSETLTYPDTLSQEDLLNVVRDLNGNPAVHGILVQLPLPDQIDENTVIMAIDPAKDVDGFHPVNVGKLAAGLTDGFAPATPSGIVELLVRSDNPPDGKHVVIVGRSNIVGKPLGMLLVQKRQGANATVTLCHSRTPDIGAYTRQADVVVAAVGRPNTITSDMVKEGVVIIDVGSNRVEDPSRKRGYRMTGDVDFENVSKAAKAITPVPGGVGPMTITMLLQNTLRAARQTLKE